MRLLRINQCTPPLFRNANKRAALEMNDFAPSLATNTTGAGRSAVAQVEKDRFREPFFMSTQF